MCLRSKNHTWNMEQALSRCQMAEELESQQRFLLGNPKDQWE